MNVIRDSTGKNRCLTRISILTCDHYLRRGGNCVNCPVNTYSVGSLNLCFTCPAGQFSLQGSSACSSLLTLIPTDNKSDGANSSQSPSMNDSTVKLLVILVTSSVVVAALAWLAVCFKLKRMRGQILTTVTATIFTVPLSPSGTSSRVMPRNEEVITEASVEARPTDLYSLSPNSRFIKFELPFANAFLYTNFDCKKSLLVQSSRTNDAHTLNNDQDDCNSVSFTSFPSSPSVPITEAVAIYSPSYVQYNDEFRFQQGNGTNV